MPTDCPYCGEALQDLSPEHVFPRSIGGRGFVIGVHESCNRRANAMIDLPLLRCARVQAARATAGVRSDRGQPLHEHLLGETILMVRLRGGRDFELSDVASVVHAFQTGEDYGGQGAKVQISRHGENLTAAFLPNPVIDASGVVNVFGTEASEGSCVPDFEPFTVLALVEARRRCRHAEDTWRRFTAKVGLGVVHLIRDSSAELDNGFRVADTLSESGFDALAKALRHVAFDTEARRVGHAEPHWTVRVDSRDSRNTARLLTTDAGAVVSVQLFGALQYALLVPDVDVRHSVEVDAGGTCWSSIHPRGARR